MSQKFRHIQELVLAKGTREFEQIGISVETVADQQVPDFLDWFEILQTGVKINFNILKLYNRDMNDKNQFLPQCALLARLFVIFLFLNRFFKIFNSFHQFKILITYSTKTLRWNFAQGLFFLYLRWFQVLD